MAIENNLPIIFDTATQTEDGLMSFNDKIKLDNLEGTLNNKLNKSDKISSSQLDISSDAVKIQPDNLSDAVKAMMTGTTPVSATVPNNGVTTEKIATNAVTIDKIDKRVLLGNVVSPRPLNFAFDNKKVSINIPQGSLLLIDATNKKPLVTGIDASDMVVNINYPNEFDGLNYIISNSSGTLTMINHRKVNEITNTNSIVALVTLSNDFNATIVMNGNYTINGLAQGIGTESAALMGTGKIIFDQQTGIIDFSGISILHLIIGGIFNRTIESQASIRLANYASDSIYCLYWDNATSSLKTDLSDITNTDTDINKIALIKDGRIIPFVNTGIYYSKPYINAPYYTESFDFIDTITVISKDKINIINDNKYIIEIPNETYVCLNQIELAVKNKECAYDGRDGLYYILFNLDDQNISCKHISESIDDSMHNIVLATFWLYKDQIVVSGNLQSTVNSKTPYQEDLANAETNIEHLKNIITPNLVKNKILVGDNIYMVEGEELPIYESSILIKDSEGIKTAISYNRNNDIMNPRIEFFTGNTILNDNVGSKISLMAYDKYDTHSYLTKDININRVSRQYKTDTDIRILCIGDDLFKDKTSLYIKNKLASYGTRPELLGTMVNDGIYNEGRSGWFYSTFVGASGRGINEGKITPQTSKGTSTNLLNPFIRIANADDKANNPNDCYRASGAYLEKTYYNDTDKNGAFYIFDFAKYMEFQGIPTPDVVILAIKPELVNAFTEDIVSTNLIYMKQLVSGIRAALPNSYIALIPQYGACTVYNDTWEITSKFITETIQYIEELNDDKIKVLSAWIHMNREFGTEFISSTENSQLYMEPINTPLDNKLSERAKIELANSIVAFIMNI